MTDKQRDWLYGRTEVGEVWGLGPRIAKALQAGGVNTVLEHEPPPKQEIACTRSFGRPITELRDLQEAVTEFASRACEKLRRQGGRIQAVLVFIRTSPFRQQDKQYARSATLPLRLPTADTVRVVNSALQALQKIYRPGCNYAKAGVMLLDLDQGVDGEIAQAELDLGDIACATEQRQTQLMVAMDAVNSRYGKGTLLLGSAGLAGDQRRFGMKQERRSPRYTTHWEELMRVG